MSEVYENKEKVSKKVKLILEVCAVLVLAFIVILCVYLKNLPVTEEIEGAVIPSIILMEISWKSRRTIYM